MTMMGSDARELDASAATMRGGAETLSRIERRISALLMSPAWSGPDADSFRHEWSARHRAHLRDAQDRLSAAAWVLSANAEQQRRASAEGLLPEILGGVAGLASHHSGRVAWPSTPTQAREWWASLSAEERTRLMREYPERLGHMDGLPGQVRDEANRQVIKTEIQRLRDRLDDLEKRLDSRFWGKAPWFVNGMFTNEDREATITREKIRALQNLESMSGSRQILLVDTSGERVRAAVSAGDVDTARNIAVIVPGLGASVEQELPGYMRDAASLAGKSWMLSDERTAVVVWLGYETPQGHETLDPSRSVAGDAVARDASPELLKFLAGLDSNRDGEVRMTAIGHSYGSLVTGFTLASGDHPVDSVVFVGSPGIGVDDVHELGLPAGQVFVAENRFDGVADLGRFEGDPNQMTGTIVLETGERDSRLGSSGHGLSDYLRGGSSGLLEVARVVCGQTEDVVTAGDRSTGTGDLLRISAEPRLYPLLPNPRLYPL